MIERNGAVRALDQNVTLVVLQAEQLLALLSHSPWTVTRRGYADVRGPHPRRKGYVAAH